MLKSTGLFAALMILAGAVAGCGFVGPSLDAFYTPAVVTVDDSFVGVWAPAEEKDEPNGKGSRPSEMAVTPLGKGHYRIEFIKADGTPTGDATINGTLFKLGASTYLDATLSDDTRKAINEKHFGMVLFPHYLMKLDIGKDDIQFYAQDADVVIEFGKGVTKSPFVFRPLADGDRPKEGQGSLSVKGVLVGTPEELQRAVTVAESRGLFKKAGSLKRVKPEQK